MPLVSCGQKHGATERHAIESQRRIGETESKHAVYLQISGRVDRASATETVDTGSIPGRIKQKTVKFGVFSSLA